MRDLILALGFVAIVTVGVYMWQSNIDPLHPFLSAISGPIESAPSAPEPAAPAAKPKPAVPVVPREPVVAAPVISEAAHSLPPSTPAVAPTPLPFPTADKIAAGSPGDTVTTEYGGPAIAAVTSADGHMVETYVYARKGDRSQTVIRLEEGRVAEAYTRMFAAPVSGMSIPRPNP